MCIYSLDTSSCWSTDWSTREKSYMCIRNSVLCSTERPMYVCMYVYRAFPSPCHEEKKETYPCCLSASQPSLLPGRGCCFLHVYIHTGLRGRLYSMWKPFPIVAPAVVNLFSLYIPGNCTITCAGASRFMLCPYETTFPTHSICSLLRGLFHREKYQPGNIEGTQYGLGGGGAFEFPDRQAQSIN